MIGLNIVVTTNKINKKLNENFGFGINNKLKEIKEIKTKIGEDYFHIFEDKDKNRYKIKTTKENYNLFSRKGKPQYKDYKWINSYGGVPVYSIFIPALNDNEYFILDNATTTGKVRIKLKNENEKEITIQKLNLIK